MRVVKSREIVIEVERIQLVRRRSKSSVAFCESCSAEADFMSLAGTALLFGTNSADLLDFIKENNSHYTNGRRDELLICINSLIACMNRQTSKLQIKMIETAKQ